MRYPAILALSLLAGLGAGMANAENGAPPNAELSTCVQALANCRDRQAEQEETLAGLVKQNEGCEAGKDALDKELTQARVATRACQSLYGQQEKALVGARERIARLQAELEDTQEKLKDALADLEDSQTQGRQDREEANRCQVERDGLQRTLAAHNRELAAAQEAIAKLRKERESLQQALNDTRQGMRSCQQEKAQVAARGERTRQALRDTQARLAETETENQRLTRTLSDMRAAREHCQALYDGLEAKTTQVQRTADACRIRSARTERELERLRSRIPRSEGGRLGIQDLQTAAHEAAAVLTQAFRAKHRRTPAPGADTAYAKAARNLADVQFQIARMEGRSGVYRVHPRDTLASIARWYYGRGNAWKRIYEANRHVLSDPDRLIPGMTLVVP